MSALTVVSLLVTLVAVARFAAGVRLRLSTGMTGFDSTWYHGPLAAEFFQTGNTFDLHFIAPQYLAWFYPANAEILHAIGMVAFDRDILSPLINFGWFSGCLLAAWCIGRAYRVGPVSLALVAVALSVPVLGDQAGEARNDLVGIFFLLAAMRSPSTHGGLARIEGSRPGCSLVVGLAAGLAAGTKLNFVLPAAGAGGRLGGDRAPRGDGGASLRPPACPPWLGGGYWYLRNLIQAGNPLPWVRHLGPISLPGARTGAGRPRSPQRLRVPDRRLGLVALVPAGAAPGALDRLAAARRDGAGGVAALPRARRGPAAAGLRSGRLCRRADLAARADLGRGAGGMPRGFESALRYLTPALVLGMALLPIAPPLGRVTPGWALGRPPLALGGARLGAGGTRARLLLAALVFG